MQLAMQIMVLLSIIVPQTYAAHRYSRNGYTVWVDAIITDGSSQLQNFSLVLRMVDVFFTVYPREIQTFNNPNSAKTVYFDYDRNYTGVAETANARVRFSVDYFNRNPADVDVVTHEVMHIVQAYSNNNVPWWLTEGIADYARFRFGVANAAAGWSLTPYVNTQNYSDGYRITARFLVWLEANGHSGLATQLDARCRANTMTDATWSQLTGKTVQALWADYAANPNQGMAG